MRRSRRGTLRPNQNEASQRVSEEAEDAQEEKTGETGSIGNSEDNEISSSESDSNLGEEGRQDESQRGISYKERSLMEELGELSALDISTSTTAALINTPKSNKSCPIPNHSPRLPFAGKISVTTHDRAEQFRLTRLDSIHFPEADKRPSRERSAPGRLSLSPRPTLTASGGLLSMITTATRTLSPTHLDSPQPQIFQQGPPPPTNNLRTSPLPNLQITPPPESSKAPTHLDSPQPQTSQHSLPPPTNNLRTSLLPNLRITLPPESTRAPPSLTPTGDESSPERSPNAPQTRTRDPPKEATATAPTLQPPAAGVIAEEKRATLGDRRQLGRPSGIPAPANWNPTPTTSETTKRGTTHP